MHDVENAISYTNSTVGWYKFEPHDVTEALKVLHCFHRKLYYLLPKLLLLMMRLLSPCL